MTHLAIELMGGFRVALDGNVLVNFDSNKVRALLVYLAVEAARAHSREYLAGLLWPEMGQKASLDSLRNALSNLRRVIGDHTADPPFLLINRESLQWNARADTTVDVDALEAGMRVTEREGGFLETWQRALDGYQGAFLEGFSLADSAPFEEWVILKREQTNRLAIEAARRLADFYEIHGEVDAGLRCARKQAEIEPWNEEAHRQIMRICALSGQISAALAQYERCKRLLSDELAIEPAVETERLYAAIRAGRMEEIRAGDPLPAPGEPPFKGLLTFEEKDAELFFGREALVQRLAAMLTAMERGGEMRLLAIVGASGSGKSSLARAGVVPALRKAGRMVEVFTPAERGRAGRQIGGRESLWVVDQFEEVFTLLSPEEQGAFIARALGHAEVDGGVVLTLRADFYAACAQYPRLREAIGARQVYIGAMDAGELRRAIELPARRGGWQIEAGLVELILQDLGAGADHQPEPGALPLLEHALLETWKRRRGRMLTLKGYAEAGGVRGAIARTADAVFMRLSSDEQDQARRIFTRLTALGEGVEDTRRRAGLTEFPGEAERINPVLRALGDARLVILSENGVEVAHEALIREWPLLRKWMNERRDFLRLHRRLSDSALAWEKGGREESDLMRGARLAWAVEASEQPRFVAEINMLEKEYIRASREAAERVMMEEEARRQRELRAARRLAEERAETAARLRREAQLAFAQELAALARGKQEREPDFSLLLALRAVDLLQEEGLPIPWLIQQAVHEVTLANRLIWRVSTPNQPWHVRVSADGEDIFYTDDARTLHILSAADGRELAAFVGSGRHFCFGQDFFYTSDGTMVVFWLRRERRRYAWIDLPGERTPCINRVAISLDGRRLAVTDGMSCAYLYDLNGWLSAGKPEGVIQIGPSMTLAFPALDCLGLIFSPDGDQLFTGCCHENRGICWDTRSGEILAHYGGHSDKLTQAVFSSDGRFLVTGSFDHTIQVWDNPVVNDRAKMRLTGHTHWVNDLAFSPDGSRLASAGFDGQVKFWEFSDGSPLFSVRTAGGAYGVDFTPDGNRAVVSLESGAIELWDASPAGRGGLHNAAASERCVKVNAGTAHRCILEIGGGQILLRDKNTLQVTRKVILEGELAGAQYASLNREETRLAVTGPTGRSVVIELETGRTILDVPPTGPWRPSTQVIPVFSPDGRLLVTTEDNAIIGREIQNGSLVFRLGGTLFMDNAEFSADGGLLAVTCNQSYYGGGGQARIWSFDPHGPLADNPLVIAADIRAANHSDFSPEGGRLAVCGCENIARVFAVEEGREIAALRGHASRILMIHFSPDGNSLVTVSIDGSAKVWDAASGKELLSFRSPTPKGFEAAFFTPDSRQIVLYGDGNYMQTAFKNFEDLLALARSRVTRAWREEEIENYLRGRVPAGWH